MAEIFSSSVSLGARRYAGALFSVAREESCLDSVAEILHSLSVLLEESADFRRFIACPLYNAKAQTRFISAFAEKSGLARGKGKSKNGSGAVCRFLKVLAQRGRLHLLPGIIAAFSAQLAEARGDVDVFVTSAERLSAEQQETVLALLADLGRQDKRFSKYCADKNLHLHMQTDASLLGGFMIRCGSLLVDATLRSKLFSLKLALKEVR